jgi:hypothetical protein
MLNEMQPLNYSLGTAYGTAANFVRGIRFSIPLDMKVVELAVMPFNSQ